MTLERSTVLAGTGRLTGAVERDGKLDFFIDTGSAIVRRQMPRGRRGISSEGIASYAEAYTETETSSLAVHAGEVAITRL